MHTMNYIVHIYIHIYVLYVFVLFTVKLLYTISERLLLCISHFTADHVAPRITHVRLLDGAADYEGRAEVFADGVWQTVCRDGFDEVSGGRFCRQLGFDGLKELETAHPLFLAENQMPPIFPDAIRCRGTETSLSTCPIIDEDLSACTRNNETAVRCNCEYIRTLCKPAIHLAVPTHPACICTNCI